MEEAALRAGVGPAYVERLVELGLVEVGDDGQVTEPAIRRLLLLHQLDLAGLPLEGLARLVAERRPLVRLHRGGRNGRVRAVR